MLVGAVLGAAVELGPSDDRAVEFAGEELEPPGERGDFLLAVFGAGGGRHELDVVDEHGGEGAAAGDGAGVGGDVGGGDGGPVVDGELEGGDVGAVPGDVLPVEAGELCAR